MIKRFFSSKKDRNSEQNKIDSLRLIRSENVGIMSFFELIRFYETPQKALETIEELSLKGGKNKPIKIFPLAKAQQELEALQKIGANLVTFNEAEYPKLLLEIADAPPVLSYMGNIELFTNKAIAIVGARNSSMNGQIFAKKLAQELTKEGFTIVSGLARGIDTAAHKGALLLEFTKSSTIAVLGGGIDNIYPLENKELYHQIAEKGLIIAELPIGKNPLGQNFPQRNRIISGLSLGTIVVEANLQSGSLITARTTLEQNRELFAVPGFPLDPRSQGTNKLLKNGAHLVSETSDVIANLPYYAVDSQELKEPNTKNYFSQELVLDVNETMRKEVKGLISYTPIDIDTIATNTGLPLSLLYMIILELELAGKINRSNDNRVTLNYEISDS